MQKISIITACYNSEKYIEQTIQSAIDQTYKNIEYIIVDGGSTDSTLPILEKYRDNIQKIISEPDQGVYDAFNKGIQASTGDIIYFLNSDDYLVDNKVIEDVMTLFEANQGFDMIYGNIVMKNEETGFETNFGKKYELVDLMSGKMPPHPGSFLRSKTIKKYDGFNLEYKIASDFDLITRIFKNEVEKISYFDRMVACFRLGGLSSSIKNKDKTAKETRDIVKKYFGTELPTKSIMEQNMSYYKAWLESLLFSNMPISNVLVELGIRKVALFGTMEMALYVKEDFKRSGIQTLVFLDNNPTRQGVSMNGITIHSPNWLKENSTQVDAIILSFEGNYEKEIKDQIDQLVSCPIPVYSWKELIEMK
ncbi:MAG TPA: glycosyltransferase [Bacillus bacterium]|nr:glycosyltransferase [Bacillus sp. (in: firmicutes)]